MVLEVGGIALLKLAVGAASVAYSVYNTGSNPKGNSDPTNNSVPDKAFDSIFGEFVGGIVFGMVTGGASTTYSNFKAKYASIHLPDKDKLNHDLQKAVRKSQLIATYFAAQNCLEKLNEKNDQNDSVSNKGVLGKTKKQFKRITNLSIFKRITNFFVKDNVKKGYLEGVIKYLAQEIKNVDSSPIDLVTPEGIDEILKEYKNFTSTNLEKNVSTSLKEDILYDLKTKIILEGSPFDQETFRSLKTTMEEGWEELPEENKSNEKSISLSITPPKGPATGKKYDWFNLFCSFFIEEYKTNSRVQAVVQKNLLNDISNQMSDRFGKLDSNLDLIVQNIFDIAKDIAEIKEATVRIEKGIERIERTLERVYPYHCKPQSFVGIPSLSDNIYGREEEAGKILEFLQGQQRHAAIVAPSCFGKTYLIKKFLSETIDKNEVKGEYKSLFEKIIYIDCDQINSTCSSSDQFNHFSEITKHFGTLIGRSFEYTKGDETSFLTHEIFNQIGNEKILLIFDNFEAWVNPKEERFLNSDIKVFIQTLLNTEHSMRSLFVSQLLPQNESGFRGKIEVLGEIGEKLLEGLNPEDALNLIREEGKLFGLDNVNPNVLKEFLEKIHYIPQAIQSMIGYIANEKITFAEFRKNYNEFDREEAGEFNADEGQNKFRPTKTLLRMQIETLPENAKHILSMMAFLNNLAPEEIFKVDFSDEEKIFKGEESRSLRRALNGLKEHCLIKADIDEFTDYDAETGEEIKIVYYSLHSYIRKVILEDTTLERFEEKQKGQLENFGDLLIDKSLQLVDPDIGLLKQEFLRKADALAMCSIKVEDHLVNSLEKKDREKHLAASQLKKAIVLLRGIPGEEENPENAKVAEEILTKMISSDSQIAEPYYILGTKQFQAGNYAEAKAAYEEAIKRNPKDSKSLTNLGVILGKLGDKKGAQKHFSAAIEFNSKDYNAFFNLADLQAGSGKYEEAESNAKKVIELNPKMSDAYNLLGEIQQMSENVDEAETNYKKALELNPENSKAFANLEFLQRIKKILAEQVH